MMTITARDMYRKSVEAHLSDAEKVRDAIEPIIKRASDAELTSTVVSFVINNHMPSDATRATVCKWLKDAGFKVATDPDLHPGSFHVYWSQPE